MADNMIYSLSSCFNIYFCGGPFLWRPLGTCPVCPVLNPALPGRSTLYYSRAIGKSTDAKPRDAKCSTYKRLHWCRHTEESDGRPASWVGHSTWHRCDAVSIRCLRASLISGRNASDVACARASSEVLEDRPTPWRRVICRWDEPGGANRK